MHDFACNLTNPYISYFHYFAASAIPAQFISATIAAIVTLYICDFSHFWASAAPNFEKTWENIFSFGFPYNYRI